MISSISCYLLKHGWFVFGFVVVAELDVALDAGELAGFVQGDGMGAIQDGISGLNVEQIQLNRVARIDVLIRKEKLSSKQNLL